MLYDAVTRSHRSIPMGGAYFSTFFTNMHYSLVFECIYCRYKCISKTPIPPARIWSARNAKYAHASDFVVMTTCYYPSWRHSYRALTHYTVLETLDVFGLRVVAEQSVAPTNSSPLVLRTVNRRTAPDTPTNPRGTSPGLPSIHNRMISDYEF